jgi:putative membrane protein
LNRGWRLNPLSFNPQSFNPQSSILNPQSSILNPQSSILNPQSSILNPQSSILNPQSTFWPHFCLPAVQSMKRIAQFVAVAAVSAPLLAHEGEVHGAAVMSVWTFDPLVLTLLAVSAVLYGRGVLRLDAIRRWHIASFYGGLATIFVAQISPLDHASDLLFSAHMTQHELLVLIAAPLLVFGQPLAPMLRGLPGGLRASVLDTMRRRPAVRLWQALTAPLNVWVLHAAVILVWHIPALYEAAIRSDAIHFVQHATFIGTAVLFWWALVHGRYGRLGYGMAVLYVFATALYSGALGALITFAPRLWYPIYDERTRALALDPLADQQLAGLIMWIPAGALLIVVGVAFFAAWLGAMERRGAALEERS